MKIRVGDLLIGKVTGVKPYALFLTFENGQKGLLHISEISDDYIRDIEQYGTYDDEIKVKVMEIDPTNNFLRLSYKRVPVCERYSSHDDTIKRTPKIAKDDFAILEENLPHWIKETLIKAKEEKEMIDLDLDLTLNKEELDDYTKKVKVINQMIINKNGLGNDFLGWVDWPVNYDKEELERIIKCASIVRANYDVLVVCGIGGSYLGARAAIEALKGLKSDDKLEIIFMGQTFSPNYIAQILNYLKDKKIAINVISKSGTTTETSISFRLLKELLEKQVGKEEARKAIFATTDKSHGALKTEAINEGYETFTLPGDIGGRYSVLTAVGLFPLACANIDIKKMLDGAKVAREEFQNDDLLTNKCYKYAVARDYFYRHNKSVELFVTYEPQMSQISEWLKQLFGESEGKDKKGLFPASVTFSTDLHSLGQFIQDGSPILFETILNIKNPQQNVVIPHDNEDLDGLNYLEGKDLSFVNQKAFEGTLKAHKDGGVNCNVITVDKLDEFTLGYLFYFYMRACAMSAYLLDINPFNQPGVEIYKKNMFHLLGKKGY